MALEEHHGLCTGGPELECHAGKVQGLGFGNFGALDAVVYGSVA